MSPTKKTRRVHLTNEEIEDRINQKLDEAISKLETAKNYMIMFGDTESVEKVKIIIREIDTFFME